MRQDILPVCRIPADDIPELFGKLAEVAEPPLRQIIDVLQQVMCKHDAEKLAISVLEIWEDGYQYRCDVERESSRHGSVKKSVHTTGIH
jgi:hypothetical protein